MVGIYKITSPTGKVYIGQSWNIEKRCHSYSTPKQSKYQIKLHHSILKHGWPAHTFEVLMNVSENVTQQMFDEIEQAYIDYYRNNGYELLNIREAGSHGKMSEESKEKMREAAKGRTFSEDHKRKLRENHNNVQGKNNSRFIGNVSVYKEGELIGVFAGGGETARILNISPDSVYNGLRRKTNKSGFTFIRGTK